jgi:hypothetical protein
VILLSVAAASLAAATLAVDRTHAVLEVLDTRSRRVIWRRVVTPAARVELHYRHSVEQTPVVEVFQAEPDGLRFVEMRFVSQGAGLPTEGYVREGGLFVLRRPRRVGALPVLVSALAGHRLRAGSEEVDLVGLAGDGGHVALVSRRATRLRWPGAW